MLRMQVLMELEMLVSAEYGRHTNNNIICMTILGAHQSLIELNLLILAPDASINEMSLIGDW